MDMNEAELNAFLMDEEEMKQLESQPKLKKQKTEDTNNNVNENNNNMNSMYNKEKNNKIIADDEDREVDIDMIDAEADMDEDLDISLHDRLSQGGSDTWKRPPLPHMEPLNHTIAFQKLEIDYITAKPVSILPVGENVDTNSNPAMNPNPDAPLIRVYGVTEHGNSILVNVHGVIPYFYIPVWADFNEDDCTTIGRALNAQVSQNPLKRYRDYKQFVLSVQIVEKQSIWGYHHGKLSTFLKIEMASPPLVAAARRILGNGIHVGLHGYRTFTTYESNLPFVLRFMVDKDIQGMSWIELPPSSYKIRPDNKRMSRCQLEVDIHHQSLIVHQPEGEWLKQAPLRILSFDIECAGRKNIFPEPEIDPVIQIANIVVTPNKGENDPICKNIFTLKSCAPIHGSQVLSYEDERRMLMEWMNFLITVDPDVITGYNIVNFDLPYLLDRARTLKLKRFPYLGRIVSSQTNMKDSTFSSKAYGTRTDKDISIDGRVQFDLLTVIRREYKLRSYTLNAVSAHFLEQQKEDVHHSIITDLQNGNADTRKRLAVYCIKDAVLPVRLLQKLMLLVNYIEMARVTGVPLVYLLTRGQQIKVISQLYRKAKQKQLIIPVRERMQSEETYEGATVIEPKKGYYTDPIATLDFASLYPSIMMAHNLCYSTLLSNEDANKMSNDDITRTPTGHYFIKRDKQVGLLPEILNELLAARKKAKKDLKAAEKGTLEHAVLNGRQLALKISANSVYGFTGATVGQLPCLPISASVTAFGRDMIQATKKAVEERYKIANGYAHDAEVIYGDTDSVMVKFGCSTVEEAMRLGEEAAAFVSKIFVDPIKLEFEKVYYPYLLMNKKRYAGLYWTNPKHWDKMDAKGIETVRRDNCALVGQVIQRCLDLILQTQDVNKAIEYVKNTIRNLLANRLDLSLLVISKSLSQKADNYKNIQAHAALAERMAKRDPASAPKIGDRVPYVIIEAAKNAKQYEKAEDPIYVLEKGLAIDTKYYVENQLKLPLTRLFEPIMGEDKISSLFAGDHTRYVKRATLTNVTSGIMKFVVKQRTCMGCKTTLKKSEKGLCAHCRENSASLYMKQVQKVRTFEKLYGQVWSQCQRCTGSLHQDVLCTSRDCPIFYRRVKAQKDLEEAENRLQRFTI